MIERQKERLGWEFLFVGANIDAVGVAGNIGIKAERSANYSATPKGTRRMYSIVSDAVCEVRMNKSISDNWSDRMMDEETSIPDFLNKGGK